MRWAQLINSCGRGTWHVVGRLLACDIPLRHVLRLISNGFKNSNVRPLHRDTVPLITHTLLSTIAVVIDTCICMPGVARNDNPAVQSKSTSKGSVIVGQQ